MTGHLDACGAAVRSDDPGTLSSALAGGEFELLPRPGGAFRGTLRQLQAGGIAIQHAVLGPHVSRNALSRGAQTLLVPIGHTGPPPIVNGATLASDEALLIPGGAEFHCNCAGDVEWVAVALPPGLLENAGGNAPMAAVAAGAVSRVALRNGALSRVSGTLASVAAFAEHPPELLTDQASLEILGLSLRDLLAGALTASAGVAVPSRAARDGQRVVLLAEDFAAAHMDKPIYVEDLCTELRVSRRKLHDAFVSTVGQSPYAYLKALRLGSVRRALQRLEGNHSLVKVVAYDHGFWHLGHFANDYREMFGETPSATLAAALQRRHGMLRNV